jgi:hypothetical protein
MLLISRGVTVLAGELAASRLSAELLGVGGDKGSCEHEKDLLALGRK